MFTTHLEKIFKDENLKIQSHSLHPGVVNTDLFENSSTTYIPWIRDLLFKVSFKLTLIHFFNCLLNFLLRLQTPEEGARTIMYAAISPKLEDKGGSYLSNCSKSKINPITNNVAACKKLFDFTLDSLKIKDFGISQ